MSTAPLEILHILDLVNKSANWQTAPFEAEWHAYPPTSAPDQKVCDLCLAMDGKRYRSEDEFDARPHPNCRCLIHIFTEIAGGMVMEYWTEPPAWEG